MSERRYPVTIGGGRLFQPVNLLQLFERHQLLFEGLNRSEGIFGIMAGLKRCWELTRIFLFAGVFAAVLAGGLFSNPAASGLMPPAVVAFCIWLFVFTARIYTKRHKSRADQADTWHGELEIGVLLVVGVYAAIQTGGGIDGPVYPLVYVLVCFFMAFVRLWVGIVLVAGTIALELVLTGFAGEWPPMDRTWLHILFIVLFAMINVVFTRAELIRLRHRTAGQLERFKTTLANDARDFRLLSALSTGDISGASPLDRAGEESRRISACVDEVRRTMQNHVALLKRTMDLHTCLLLWLDDAQTTLRRMACMSDSTHISHRNIERREGAIGAVMRNGEPLCLKELQAGSSTVPEIPYYNGRIEVTDFIGVPIVENDAVRGILCADRLGNRPFGKVDQENLEAAVNSILQIIANERILSQLQHIKSEQGRLLNASNTLTKALTEGDVLKAALEAAAQIAPFDFAAVALAQDTDRLVLRRVKGSGVKELEGMAVSAGGSLTASVLKNRHCLPVEGKFNPAQQVIFNKESQHHFLKMKSLLVLPLGAGEEILGTLTLAAGAEGAFTKVIRTTLQVMTNQLGTVLQNARMVRRLEELATTDGLTGLPNHRIFQEELSRQLALSKRFQNETSIILCDVDRFKGVNDTYGHPVGDRVLRGLGDLLRADVQRNTDLPARYGGEEFAVICAGTGTAGALKLAEKIRVDLERRIFSTDMGDLRVTLSMGVATYPQHAASKEQLVERADAALYAAKENGRNQVRVWQG
jgi:two-component system cell cycle response regulator